ncbi:SufE family protein [Breoghania sp. L-A4]|uniref:SufE family protein n=1 Tax=Breoghania sp. L-A4 TaxID=2304600 RepID=UPI000E35D8B1|nr:SufE family protein [Breoghania sp. L-A4]AXS39931.1 SufE family protein [Breoghania sp. L-A4]
MTKIDEIIDNFEFLDDWEDRYRYVIELGKDLPELPENLRTDANKVRGCVSQVWLATRVEPQAGAPARLTFEGDSDAHIVRGLVAILLALYDGCDAREILQADAEALFQRLGLRDHLTPQRSNGLSAMIQRVRADAEAALAAA